MVRGQVGAHPVGNGKLECEGLNMRVDIYMMMNMNARKKKASITCIELVLSFFILTIFRVFIHEMGHVIMAILNGIKLQEIVIGFDSGSVSFYDLGFYSIESMVMVGLGSIMLDYVVFIPLFIMTRKKLKIFAIVFLIVLTAETLYFTRWDSYSDINAILHWYPEGELFFKSLFVVLSMFFCSILTSYFASALLKTCKKYMKPEIPAEMIAFYELHDKIMEQHDDHL